MPPSATLCQSAPDAAVGRSAKTRNVAGPPEHRHELPVDLDPGGIHQPGRHHTLVPAVRRRHCALAATGARSPARRRAAACPAACRRAAAPARIPGGAGSIIVAELSRTEPCPAGVAPRWAARPATKAKQRPWRAGRAPRSPQLPHGASRRAPGPTLAPEMSRRASIPTPSPLYRIPNASRSAAGSVTGTRQVKSRHT